MTSSLRAKMNASVLHGTTARDSLPGVKHAVGCKAGTLEVPVVEGSVTSSGLVGCSITESPPVA